MLLKLLGVGAMRSPRYAPAGLLVAAGRHHVMFDGGDGATPLDHTDAWLVTDERGELLPAIRRLAAGRGIIARVAGFRGGGLEVEPRAVLHTSHPAFGYLIRWHGRVAVWAPEFWRFPRWAAGADLMFAEAAGWGSPIRFRGGVGGHLNALGVARQAQRYGVRRLVFAHIGRPTIRAMERGERPPFGEFGRDGQAFLLRSSRARSVDRRPSRSLYRARRTGP